MKKKIFCILMSLCLVLPCAFILTGCGHKHSASSEWSSDETSHWHACTGGDNCSEKIDNAEHTWDEGETTLAPTCTEKGQKTFTCSVCLKTKTIAIPELGHAFEEELSYDESHHWYAATCEHETEQKDKAEHVFSEWTTKSEKTCTSPEIEIRSCECGYSEERNGDPATGHTYASKWSTNSTHHWYAATCEHSSEVSNKQTHDWDSGVIVEKATFSKEGKLKRTCNICTYSETIKIDKLTEREQSSITNVQDLTKMYDGTAVANPTFEKIGDGAISYEWFEGSTPLATAPTKAGTYKVKVVMAQGTDYKSTEATKEFSIIKVALNITNIQKPYDATNSFTSPALADHGLIDGDDVLFTASFDGVDVGSKVKIGDENTPTLTGTDAINYYVSSWSGSVVTKELTNIEFSKMYDGDATFTFTATALNGVVNDEVVSYIFTADDKNVSSVGRKVLISFETTTPETSKNYTFKLNNVYASITPKPLTNIVYSHEFNGDKKIGISSLTAENGVIGEDQVGVSGKFESVNVGAAIASIELSGANKANYSLDISEVSASITKTTVDEIAFKSETTRQNFLNTCYCGNNYDILKSTSKYLNQMTVYIYSYLNLPTWVNKNNVSIAYYEASDTSKQSPLASKPKTAGSYTLVLTVADTDNYTGSSFETTYSVSHKLNNIGSCSCGHSESVEITLTENTGSVTQNFAQDNTYYFHAEFEAATAYTIALSGEFGTIAVYDSNKTLVSEASESTYTFETAGTYYIVVTCSAVQENGTLSINV